MVHSAALHLSAPDVVGRVREDKPALVPLSRWAYPFSAGRVRAQEEVWSKLAGDRPIGWTRLL